MKASPFQKLSNSIRKFSDAERSPFASCGEPLRAFSFGPQKFTPSRIVRGDHPMKKLVVFLSVVVALLSGCNGSNTVTVTFASPSQAIDNGQSVNITVTVKDSKNAGVTWTLSGPGALSKSGGNFGHLHGSSYWRRHPQRGGRFKRRWLDTTKPDHDGGLLQPRLRPPRQNDLEPWRGQYRHFLVRYAGGRKERRSD